MPDLYMDVDTALSEVPVNILALIDDTDFKTRETGIVYNQAGMDLVWNFITTGGAYTQTAVTPTTAGDYDWASQGDAMYSLEMPASGGASINNDTEGVGWFSGICTGVLPWRGPTIGFRAAGINNLLIDSAYSATRGLAGTALPAAAADAAGGLPISDAGGLALDNQLANTHEITAARMGALTDWINDGRLDVILDAILVDTGTTLPANQTLLYDRMGAPVGADISADIADIPTVAEFEARTISSSAAGNLEDTYDGTGYTDDVAPATQEQIGRLSSGSAAINTIAIDAPDGFVITTGTNEVNTEDVTHELDGVVHSLEPSGGTTDAYYIFNVGSNGIPVSVTWDGYANTNLDTYDIYSWNWNNSTWEQVASIAGSPGSTIITRTFIITTSQVGSGANIGDVYLRFYSTDGTKFSTDRIICSYSIVSRSVGYAEGAVWVDTTASNTNTESFVDGVADNPVSTIAAATTIAGNVGLKRFVMLPGSSITLAQAYAGFQFDGSGYTIDLNGQSISGCRFLNCTVSGDDSGTNANPIRFSSCLMLGNKLGKHALLASAIAGDMEFGEAYTYLWDSCASYIAGTSTPSLDFGAGLNASDINIRHYSGGIEVENMGAGTGSYNMSLEGHGQLIINANCSATSVIAVRGHFTVTDNASGAVTLSDDARYDVDQITDAVIDDDTKLDGSAINALSANDPGASLATTANQTLIYDRIGSPAGADIAADIATRSSLSAADVNAEVDTALTDIHLDHLLAVDYDPASKPGTATALLNELIESDGGISRYTANALEQAPSGTGGDATAAKQDTIITHLTEVKGAGFIESTDSNEAIRNRGDAAWGGSAASYVGAQGGQLLNFRVNEKSGSFVYDKIHSDYKGILEDGVTFEEGVKGKSLTFDGSGSVKCQQNFDEKRYSGNPVIPTLTGAGGAYAPYGLYDPSILFVGAEIWIYYSAVGDDGHIREGLSISTDGGLTFEDYGMVLDVGAEGEWDDWKAHDVDVIYDDDDSTYKMWYNGNLLPDNPGKIGLATSADGKVWTKYAGNPVFDVDVPGSWDDTGVNYPTVIKEDGIFYMWYGGYNSVPEYGGMGLATSPDGITWTRVQATPVLPSNDFHKYTVTKQNNVYYVIFVANNSYQQLAMGYSTDRLNWTVNYHPVIQAGESLEWDSIVIEDADFYFDGTDAKVYYSGATIKGQNNQIGLITIEDLEEKIQKAEILNQYPISICCWIKTTDSGTGNGIIKRGLDSELDVYNIYMSVGRLKAYYVVDDNNKIMMTAEADDGGIINDGLWHHIIFIVDASGGELFVDLISQNTKAWTGTPGATTSTQFMEIGEYNEILIGKIDDIRIYDHALSSDERRGIYVGLPYIEDNTLEIIRDQETMGDSIDAAKGINFDTDVDSLRAIRINNELFGSNAITINLKDQNSNNVVECAVEIWDQANTVFYERKITNSNGDTSHNIDNGTYTVRIHKAGYIFTDKTLIVTDAEIVNYTGTTVIIGTPATADACRVYDYAFQSDGLTPVATIDASCYISELPYDYSGNIHSGERRDAIYDPDTGALYFDLVRGSTVKFRVKHFGYMNKAKIIPDLDQARLTDI